MNTFASRLSFVFLGLLTLYMMGQTVHAQGTYQQNIISPYYEGYPLNYCFYNGKGCGKMAADKYCRDRGFMTAQSFKPSKNATVTKIMSTAQLCRGKGCSTFDSIVCMGEKRLTHPIYIPSEHRNAPISNQPNYMGERVDSCRGYDVNCAWRTADHYCQMHGYQKAEAMMRWPDAGPTRVLASNKTCQGRDNCHGYKWIRCERYPAA